MIFVETKTFTKLICEYFTDEELSDFQICLVKNPEIGNIMRGTGGLRKVRWKTKGKGKRGGVRIIYYLHTSAYKIFLLTVYSKSETSDLSATERKILKQMVEEWKNA